MHKHIARNRQCWEKSITSLSLLKAYHWLAKQAQEWGCGSPLWLAKHHSKAPPCHPELLSHWPHDKQGPTLKPLHSAVAIAGPVPFSAAGVSLLLEHSFLLSSLAHCPHWELSVTFKVHFNWEPKFGPSAMESRSFKFMNLCGVSHASESLTVQYLPQCEDNMCAQ